MTTKATVIVHWPGQDTAACLEHHLKIQRLASVLGLALSYTPCADADIECTNCRNEQLAKEKP